MKRMNKEEDILYYLFQNNLSNTNYESFKNRKERETNKIL